MEGKPLSSYPTEDLWEDCKQPSSLESLCLGAIDIGARYIFVMGIVGIFRMIIRIPDLYSRHARVNSPAVAAKNIFRRCQMSLGGASHCPGTLKSACFIDTDGWEMSLSNTFVLHTVATQLLPGWVLLNPPFPSFMSYSTHSNPWLPSPASPSSWEVLDTTVGVLASFSWIVLGSLTISVALSPLSGLP